MKVRIDHVNISVDSLKKSVKWYCDFFNFNLAEEGQQASGRNYAIVRNGDTMICMTEILGKPKAQKNWTQKGPHQINHFSFKLDSPNEFEALFKKGCFEETFPSPVKYKNSTSWYIGDPSGHEIEVVYWDNNKVRF